jgi:hypothetical protein
LTAKSRAQIVGERMSVDPLDVAEYRSIHEMLRESSATRGLVLGLAAVGWGAIATAILLVAPTPLLLAIPLAVLVAAFEVEVRGARTSEQLAAYLHVTFGEHRGRAGWQPPAPRAVHGSLQFWAYAALLGGNYLCVIIAAGEGSDPATRTREDTLDLAVITALHAAAVIRQALARRALRRGYGEQLAALRATPSHSDNSTGTGYQQPDRIPPS